MQNSRNIHFFFEEEITTFTNAIHHNQFRRRYPGEHVAISFCHSPVVNNFFDEIIQINTEEHQKIAFSPILGDEIALSLIFQKLFPLTNESFAWSFNLFGHNVCSAFQGLFQTENTLGFRLKENTFTCDDPNLRILKGFSRIIKGNSLISDSLLQKALKQFDQEQFKNNLLVTVEHKLNNKLSSTKKILIADQSKPGSREDENILANTSQIFTLIKPEDLNFDKYRFDATFVTDSPQGINISSLDLEEALERIQNSTLASVNQWFVNLIFAEYLSLSKTSFAFEKVIASYPKDLLQDYMIAQLGQLKEFVAQIILSERNKTQRLAIEAISKFSRQQNPLSMTLLIHCSQIDLSEIDRVAKIENLKNRLRNLNSIYERIYRLCSIDIPKSDLALTL